jgi:hypothetical protein
MFNLKPAISTMNKLTFLSSLLLLLLGGIIPGFAQKHCDLELSYVNPAPNSELPYGDTLWLVCGITNNGPDDIDMTDTIYYAWNNRPVVRVTWGLIPAGSTFNDTIMSGTSDEYDNETFDICHYFLHDEHTSFIDTVAGNDTACIQFVALGSVSIAIKTPSLSGPITGLYPQPAHDYLYMDLEQGTEPELVVVTDIMGRRILQENRPVRRSDNRYALNVSTLSPGMYILQLKSKNGKYATSKVLIR